MHGGCRAAIHAQPHRCSPSEGPREAKGGRLPDRHRASLWVAAGRRCWGGVCPWPDQRTDTMPTNKDFKRVVRARMRKTGEAYTAARARLLSKRHAPTPAPAPAPAPTPLAPAADYATLPARSDPAGARDTRRPWDRWVK